jgi:hypothetical protein
MVDDTQNYWGFGLLPSSGILGNRGHDVPEIGPVSFFRCIPFSPEDGNRFSFRNIISSVT